jgi:catechol 2,3-dioxygenase-like lactoylglutathione lyase family enzyme
MPDDDLVIVRYTVDDVDAAIAFYTTQFGFTVRSNAAPAFADVVRGQQILLDDPSGNPIELFQPAAA